MKAKKKHRKHYTEDELWLMKLMRRKPDTKPDPNWSLDKSLEENTAANEWSRHYERMENGFFIAGIGNDDYDD